MKLLIIQIVYIIIVILSYVLVRLYFYKINNIKRKYIWLFLIFEPLLIVLSIVLIDSLMYNIGIYLAKKNIIHPIVYSFACSCCDDKIYDFGYIYTVLSIILPILFYFYLIYLLEKLKQKIYGYDKKYILIGVVSGFLSFIVMLIVIPLTGLILHLLGFKPS